MKFYSPPILRFCYRYLFVGVFVLLPFYIAFLGFDTTIVDEQDRGIHILVCLSISGLDFVLLNFFFWDKFFAVIRITDDCLIWKCFLRRKKILDFNSCKEIRIVLENEQSGIPVRQIYFFSKTTGHINGASDPQPYIKFWYSDQLRDYLIDTLPSKLTSNLLYHKVHNKNR